MILLIDFWTNYLFYDFIILNLLTFVIPFLRTVYLLDHLIFIFMNFLFLWATFNFILSKSKWYPNLYKEEIIRFHLCDFGRMAYLYELVSFFYFWFSQLTFTACFHGITRPSLHRSLFTSRDVFFLLHGCLRVPLSFTRRILISLDGCLHSFVDFLC